MVPCVTEDSCKRSATYPVRHLPMHRVIYRRMRQATCRRMRLRTCQATCRRMRLRPCQATCRRTSPARFLLMCQATYRRTPLPITPAQRSRMCQVTNHRPLHRPCHFKTRPFPIRDDWCYRCGSVIRLHGNLEWRTLSSQGLVYRLR